MSFRIFAEQILQTGTPGSIELYALESLLSVMRQERVEDIDENLLKLWIVSEIMGGKKVSTCKRYFSKIHSLYIDWSKAAEQDIFIGLLPLFSNLSEVNVKEADANLKLIKLLLNKTEKSVDWQTVCVFFYLLYNPAASMNDVINLTFDTPRPCQQIDDIIDSFDSSHGRKYVFKLKQGKSRPHEIVKNLTKDLKSLLTSVGMRFECGFSRESITALWITAALKCHIDLLDIRSSLKTIPQEYAVLSLLETPPVGKPKREAIICTIADSINDFTTQWFVMKLRKGVSFGDVKDYITNKLPGRLNTLTLFYPTHEEIHKEGRKRVVEEVPYLPNILFFRTQKNKVKSLFDNIGDLAWCFKTANTPDSDYAVIPYREMTNFQQCIGRFTSDIKIDLIGSEKQFEIGRKVKVIGGIMAGYEGEIIDIEDEPGKRIFFLSIADNMRARWTAHVEDVFIQPIA